MSKLSFIARLMIFVCCFFAQTLVHAENHVLIVNDIDESRLISNQFAVYKQERRILTFTEFQKTRRFLPYDKYSTPNFGLVNNGAWVYTKLENRSAIQKWFLSVRFSQLQDVQLYISAQNKIIYQNTDGTKNKTSPYPLPTFELELPLNQPLELFMYVQSSSLSLVAPIYLQTELQLQQLTMLDFSIWGLYYGVLLVLFLYAVTFVMYKHIKIAAAYISHLFFLFLFQLLWSGHSSIFPAWADTLYLLIRTESMVLLISITSTLLNLRLIPKVKQSRALSKMLIYLIYANLLVLILFYVPVFSSQTKLIMMHVLAFVGLFLNLTICIRAFKKGFTPAKVLIFGWISSTLGATLSLFFIFGILPSNLFHHHIFYFTLVLQTGIFLLATVLRNQWDLEQDIQEAEDDAQNNIILFEEQNVHLDIARKQAIKASEVKSQFLANMSHEIRTPLHAIIGFSRDLETKKNLIEQDEHVRIINSAATDLLSIVNDILDLSKMEAGKLSLVTRPFSPRDMLEDVVALMAKNAHLKQLEFIYDVPELPELLLGDALKIKQLLNNLLSNALKFTNYGHITLYVRVIEQNNEVCVIDFQVKDTGIGINNLDFKKLFGAFQQLDDDLDRSYQGTGLGLVICQELTKLMGGSISVSSKAAKGSVFAACISFKIDRTVAKQKPTIKFASQLAYIIDDWQESRRTTAQQLTISGFSVNTLANIEELAHCNITSEFVFVCLPFKHIDKRPAILDRLSTINISNLVLLYSGPEPHSTSLISLRKQAKLIRLPLTTHKIKNINNFSNQFTDQKVHSQIKTLPAIRMLAVDDIEINLRLLATWFYSSPISLDLAYDGKSAIKKCESVDYDMILMDIQMPNMDGLETTQWIRKTDLNMGTPIIAVTAHALDSEKEHFLESGMDDILSKPIELEHLVALVNTWCNEDSTESLNLLEERPDSIEWDMALKRSQHNIGAAMSYLDTFVESLQTHINEIELGWQQQRTDLLLSSIHKLHGASCYTGVPRLQKFCYQAETALKTEPLNSNSQLISTLLLEIAQIIEQWPQRRQAL